MATSRSLRALLDEEVAAMERQYYSALAQRKRRHDAHNRRISKIAARKLRHAKNVKARRDRYYQAERARILSARQARIDNGDEYGFYRVVLTKNRNLHESLGSFRWLNDAQRFFEDRVSANRHDDEFMFPTTVSGNERVDDYEILLVQTDADGQPDFESVVRNETTDIFERNKVIGEKSICILRKDVWLIPENFAVVGYHPRRNRKTAQFICNEYINPFGQSDLDIVTIGTWGRRLYIRRDTDINFVNCATRVICLTFYDFLRSRYKSNKNILFIGECSQSIASDMRQLYETKSASLC